MCNQVTLQDGGEFVQGERIYLVKGRHVHVLYDCVYVPKDDAILCREAGSSNTTTVLQDVSTRTDLFGNSVMASRSIGKGKINDSN